MSDRDLKAVSTNVSENQCFSHLHGARTRKSGEGIPYYVSSTLGLRWLYGGGGVCRHPFYVLNIASAHNEYPVLDRCSAKADGPVQLYFVPLGKSDCPDPVVAATDFFLRCNFIDDAGYFGLSLASFILTFVQSCAINETLFRPHISDEWLFDNEQLLPKSIRLCVLR